MHPISECKVSTRYAQVRKSLPLNYEPGYPFFTVAVLLYLEPQNRSGYFVLPYLVHTSIYCNSPYVFMYC